MRVIDGLTNRLNAQHALPTKRLELLESLVREHIAQHDNDPEKSLGAVDPAAVVRSKLAQIAASKLQATLARVGGHSKGDGNQWLGGTLSYQPAPPSSGTRFVILRPHAKGGLGEVFVALDGELNREVALKEIQLGHANDPISRSRFVVEAEITGRLEHPGVVPVYAFGQHDDGRPYYAMRFIKGESLQEAIQRLMKSICTAKMPNNRF